jgi:hypothetical protein
MGVMGLKSVVFFRVVSEKPSVLIFVIAVSLSPQRHLQIKENPKLRSLQSLQGKMQLCVHSKLPCKGADRPLESQFRNTTFRLPINLNRV